MEYVNSYKLVNIEKSFVTKSRRNTVLKNINLDISRGEFISIVGPSGSGKSTLLSLIGGLDKPSSGQIYYGNGEISSFKETESAVYRLHEVGFIFQQFHLLETLNVLENVLSPLMFTKVDFDKNERAKKLLMEVGLLDKMSNLPSELSGGEQQRVAIARALLNNPTWILADEPTGNLDSKNGEAIFELLSGLNRKGNGVIFVTHDLKLAEKANRIIEMKDGEIISDNWRKQSCSG